MLNFVTCKQSFKSEQFESFATKRNSMKIVAVQLQSFVFYTGSDNHRKYSDDRKWLQSWETGSLTSHKWIRNTKIQDPFVVQIPMHVRGAWSAMPYTRLYSVHLHRDHQKSKGRPRADVTRSPKQGYQWPHKKDLCPTKIFLKKRYFCVSTAQWLIQLLESLWRQSCTAAQCYTWHSLQPAVSNFFWPSFTCTLSPTRSLWMFLMWSTRILLLQVQVLFEETFFNKNDESFRVLCISQPLEGEPVCKYSQESPFVSTCTTKESICRYS